jgi:hypothetical protein
MDLTAPHFLIPGAKRLCVASFTSGYFTLGKRDIGKLHLKCDSTRAESRFRLSAKRTSPFKSSRVSVQSTTGSRGVRVSGSKAGYTMFRGSVKSIEYALHSPVSPSIPSRASPCAITFHLDSTQRTKFVGHQISRKNKNLHCQKLT